MGVGVGVSGGNEVTLEAVDSQERETSRLRVQGTMKEITSDIKHVVVSSYRRGCALDCCRWPGELGRVVGNSEGLAKGTEKWNG